MRVAFFGKNRYIKKEKKLLVPARCRIHDTTMSRGYTKPRTIEIFEEDEEFETDDYSVSWVKPAVGSTYHPSSKFNGGERRRSVSKLGVDRKKG